MMPVTKIYAAGVTGAQPPINLDYMPLSKITAAVTVTPTAADIAVQVTLDQVFDADGDGYVAPASARWFTVTGPNATTGGYVTFDGPWRGIRLSMSANSGGIVFQVGQAVTPRA